MSLDIRRRRLLLGAPNLPLHRNGRLTAEPSAQPDPFVFLGYTAG
jgi:hypothetical protein